MIKERYITPAALAVVLFAFIYIVLAPNQRIANASIIHGASTGADSAFQLTTIASMPFLMHKNDEENAAKISLSDDIFSMPIAQPVVQVEEAVEQMVEVEEFAPPDVKLKSDYTGWALRNIQLQALTNAGAIINDSYYSVGSSINVSHTFEDGEQFFGKLVSIANKQVQILINDDRVVAINLSKPEW